MFKVLFCFFGYLLLLNKPAQNLVTSDNSSCLFCFQICILSVAQGNSSSFLHVVSVRVAQLRSGAFSIHFKVGSLAWLTAMAVGHRAPAPLLGAHFTAYLGFLTTVDVLNNRTCRLPFLMVWVKKLTQHHFCYKL